MLPRISTRPLKLHTPPHGQSILKIEGHGELEKTKPEFIVPDSVTIVLFIGIGVGLDDSHGKDIVSSKPVPSTLPTTYDALNREYDTDPMGTQRRETGHLQKITGGSKCPNLKLFPYDLPDADKIEINKKSYHLSYNKDDPGRFEYLSKIAESHLGTEIHWACCTVIR